MSMPAPDRAERLYALRAEVRAIESTGRGVAHDCLPFGVEAIDRHLAGGGLACAALHEMTGAAPELSDAAAATLFVAGIAARLAMAAGNGQVLWAIRRRDLFAPGLASAGLTPDRLIYAECRNDEEILAVMEESLRHGSLAAVIGEASRIAMAATRRLQLAADEGSTAGFLLRRWRKADIDPLAPPSAAATRWRIASAPSAPLPHEGIGRARWRVELVRQRGGPPHQWIMEAPDAEACLALATRSGHRPDQADGARPIIVPSSAKAA